MYEELCETLIKGLSKLPQLQCYKFCYAVDGDIECLYGELYLNGIEYVLVRKPLGEIRHALYKSHGNYLNVVRDLATSYQTHIQNMKKFQQEKLFSMEGAHDVILPIILPKELDLGVNMLTYEVAGLRVGFHLNDGTKDLKYITKDFVKGYTAQEVYTIALKNLEQISIDLEFKADGNISLYAITSRDNVVTSAAILSEKLRADIANILNSSYYITVLQQDVAIGVLDASLDHNKMQAAFKDPSFTAEWIDAIYFYDKDTSVFTRIR